MQNFSSSRIQLLPENIIDQIKAGEVIERPATLLKELLENSLDASSTKIKITIDGGGLDLISVEDNGHGISYEDLPLAFYRHATSKISKFEDIYNLYSYGFRGEALASMASVSRISCTTSTDSESSSLKIEGGLVTSHQRSEHYLGSSGTSIFVKDLFYNTPARLKFISSQTSEKNQLKRTIAGFILTRPETEFSVSFDDSARKVYPATSDQIERINALFFARAPQQFYQGQKHYDGINVRVYIGHQHSRGHTGKQQFIFVNDRIIQDATLHKIILNSAAHLWSHGEVGHYIVFIQMEPHMVDVNVHPNKINVKFHTPGKLHAVLSQTIKDLVSEKKAPESPAPLLQPEQSPASQMQQFDYKGTRYQHLQDFSDNQRTVFDYQQLSHRFAVMRLTEGQWLVDLLALALYQLDKLTSDSPHTPLMVADPITNLPQTPAELALDKLRQRGFELDQLSPQTLLLKGHASALEAFNCSALIKLILSNFDFSQELIFQNTSKQLTNLSLSEPLVNGTYDLQRMMQQMELSIAQELKICLPVDDQVIRRLFL